MACNAPAFSPVCWNLLLIFHYRIAHRQMLRFVFFANTKADTGCAMQDFYSENVGLYRTFIL
jgi:hypothetical protein